MGGDQRIEWRYPSGRLRATLMPVLVPLGALSVLLLVFNVLMVGSHFQPRFLVITALVLALLAVFVAVVVVATRRAEAATYFLDEEGLHQVPGFSFRWSELKFIKLMDWFPDKRVIRIGAKNPLRSRMIEFDPSSMNEPEFVAFVETHLAVSRAAEPVHPVWAVVRLFGVLAPETEWMGFVLRGRTGFPWAYYLVSDLILYAAAVLIGYGATWALSLRVSRWKSYTAVILGLLVTVVALVVLRFSVEKALFGRDLDSSTLTPIMGYVAGTFLCFSRHWKRV